MANGPRVGCWILRNAIDGDRYLLLARIQLLRGILGRMRPEPAREPLPPLKVYAPPRAAVGQRQ